MAQTVAHNEAFQALWETPPLRVVEENFDAEEMLLMSSEVDEDRELAARSFREYVELAWHAVEPAQPFSPNWHVDAICDHMQACKRGDITRLAINVPPGVGKSIVACVLFPTWVWSDWPGAKFISASYGDLPVKRDCLRSRGLLESAWWRERWGHQMTPRKAQWAATHYRNHEGGFRFGTTVGGSVTSEHGDFQLIDDPLKPLEVTGAMHVSKVALLKVETWEKQTMSTRFVDFGSSVRVLIMQRLHEGDPTGRALQDAGYVHLCLPMEYSPPIFIDLGDGSEPKAQPCVIKGCKAQHRTHLTPDDEGNVQLTDPRTQPGELLDADRKPRNAVDKLKRELGARGVAAQLGQTPRPAEGAIFKKHMLRYYRRADLPRLQRQIQSWDMTFKEAGSSYVCGQAWGQAGADCYLLGQRRDRWGFADTCVQVRAMSADFPKAHKKYVEAKANGNAVVDALKSEITGFELVEPEGGKESRANAVEPMFESGNVWLPHISEAPWIEQYVDELLGFPAVINDDQVDSTSQALVKLRRHSLERLRRAMANAGQIKR